MKHFLQNLLVFFSLCLCGLIAVQWSREAELRRTLQSLNTSLQEQSRAIEDLESRLRGDAAEIRRLDGLRNELSGTVKSNRLEGIKLASELERERKQNEVYRNAIQVANDSIRKQNENISRQNEEVKKLAQERNEVVQKFNQLAADHNDLAAKWNQQQSELAKTATNTPVRK